MEFYTLASGSSGNAALVRFRHTALLIDAGISAKRLTLALRALDVAPEELDAILITHEHTDHIQGLRVFCRKCAAPVYASRGTAAYLAEFAPEVRAFDAGDAFPVGELYVRSFPSSHDAADSVGYRIESEVGSLGFLTDTGVVTGEAKETLCGVDALLLEANHDVETLKSGPYPESLKRRILSRRGHLSNDAAAEFALYAARHGTGDILLAHLSRENNTPAMAEYAVARRLQANGCAVRLAVAPRDTTSEVHLCRRSPSYASGS